MIINVPVKNLKGLHDNGFAHISNYSEHSSEREVLFNAFNLFKIEFLQKIATKNIDIYELTLEYGGIKQIEDKIRRT